MIEHPAIASSLLSRPHTAIPALAVPGTPTDPAHVSYLAYEHVIGAHHSHHHWHRSFHHRHSHADGDKPHTHAADDPIFQTNELRKFKQK